LYTDTGKQQQRTYLCSEGLVAAALRLLLLLLLHPLPAATVQLLKKPRSSSAVAV